MSTSSKKVKAAKLAGIISAKKKTKVAAKRRRTVPAREFRKAPAKRKSPIPAHDATADIPMATPGRYRLKPGIQPILPTT
jgi:hypothetical protein